jgi:sirohydrochlorin ferrochelatase
MTVVVNDHDHSASVWKVGQKHPMAQSEQNYEAARNAYPPKYRTMKTGAAIVEEMEAANLAYAYCKKHWPTIRAALLAYEPPKSALRTILDRCARDVIVRPFFTPDEINAARAELDELERK